MSRKAVLNIAMILSILIFLAGAIGASTYYADLPERIGQHETVVLGQNRLTPGSRAAMRVVVRDTRDASPLAEAEINVSMQPAEGGQYTHLYSGKSNDQGMVEVVFRVPEGTSPDQKLIVETKSKLGADKIERPVIVRRDYKVLLTTDKPLYQPGQVIQIRALALGTFDMVPANTQDLEFIIADGKGNRVFRQKIQTNEFGAAWTDFQLADQVNTGNYKITAMLGDTASEKTVTVEHYVLPKFTVDLTTDRPYYTPGEHARGSLKAGYFFGKPVSGGEVQLEGYIFDVERSVVFTLQGITDEGGNFDFEFDLPDYIAGSDLEGGLGRFYLQAMITDQAEHSEISNLSLAVAQNTLVIEAIPEAGQFRPGIENILYVLTSYPDGTPAETELTLTFYDTGQVMNVETGSYGLAEVPLTPQNPYQQFLVEALDKQGNRSQRDFYFEGEWGDESILMRPDKPVYRVGDGMHLTIQTTQPQETAYLDIVREGQTLSTRSVDIVDGRAEVTVDLTPDLYGTLELHAYKILSWGGIVRDTRLVVVDNASDLNINLAADKNIYRPGDNASLDIQVNGQDGSGAQSAIGLAVVDESVFALAEQDPGFAKLYFLLEQELLQPKYDLHGFSVPDLVRGVPLSAEPAVQAVEDAAQASLAAAIPPSAGFSLQGNSRQEAIQRVEVRQQEGFATLSSWLIIAFIILALSIFGLSIAVLVRLKRFWPGLLLAVVLVALPVFLFLLWPLGEEYQWIPSPLDRLSILMNWFGWEGEQITLAMVALGLLSYLTLIVVAFVKKDGLMGWSLGLLPVHMIVLFLLLYTTSMSRKFPDESITSLGVVTFLLIPTAFCMRMFSLIWQQRWLAAVASGVLGLFILAGALPVLAVSQVSGLMIGANGLRLDAMQPMIVGEAMLEAPAMAPMPKALAGGPVATEEAAVDKATPESGAPEPPRLRQYFPETMFWLPDGVTDQNGLLQLEMPVADSITTWRITTLASSQDGRLGSLSSELRVFQDFFIDLDLPVALTVGDEVSIPVGVFNYLEEEQIVRLELEQSSWFELLDEPVKEMGIAANDISVVYFRVKIAEFGRHPFKVTALGSKMSDAIQKEVRVYPNGKQIEFSVSDRLIPDKPVQQSIMIPGDAIPGTQSLVVKIYPGIVSQVVEGLDSILRMPFGCFEQTSSTTYPNVLVMDYLKSTNQAAPEVQIKAEEYINLGYQRLTTFEVGSSGGFSLFGDAPADRMLTGYGLQEFSDMSRVHDVDEALIRRAAVWLLSQQAGDGSWENDRGLVHEDTWSKLGNDRLPVTAYIVWSLVEAGFGNDSGTQKGLAYLRENQADADDVYVLALLANALVSADLEAEGAITTTTQDVLNRLASQAVMDGESTYWRSGVATFMGSEGQTGSIETTALAALALLKAESHPELASAALTYLVRQKDSFGTWYSTQATVLSLKALLQSVRTGAESANANVIIKLNSGQTKNVQVTPENFDLVQLVSFDDVNPGRENLVEITVEGQGNLMYQVSGQYYLPWDKLTIYPDIVDRDDQVTIDVRYNRTELEVNDTVRIDVAVTLNQPGSKAESALIDLGLPPGFSVETGDLTALVAKYDDVPEDYALPIIQRFELTGRQILIYVSNLSSEHPLHFNYRLRAKFPLVAQAPASNAYDYYNPEVNGEVQPQMLVVHP